MQHGTFKETVYLIEYTNPNKTEGGPISIRMEHTLAKAYKLYDRIKADPELSGVTITRQDSAIKRERIA